MQWSTSTSLGSSKLLTRLSSNTFTSAVCFKNHLTVCSAAWNISASKHTGSFILKGQSHLVWIVFKAHEDVGRSNSGVQNKGAKECPRTSKKIIKIKLNLLSGAARTPLLSSCFHPELLCFLLGVCFWNKGSSLWSGSARDRGSFTVRFVPGFWGPEPCRRTKLQRHENPWKLKQSEQPETHFTKHLPTSQRIPPPPPPRLKTKQKNKKHVYSAGFFNIFPNSLLIYSLSTSDGLELSSVNY